MSKNKPNNQRGKSDKYTELTYPVDYIAESGEDGEMAIGISTRHLVQLDLNPTEVRDGILELNGFEAIRLGKALIKAAHRLDGGR